MIHVKHHHSFVLEKGKNENLPDRDLKVRNPKPVRHCRHTKYGFGTGLFCCVCVYHKNVLIMALPVEMTISGTNSTISA
jgi:hypothetical protein